METKLTNAQSKKIDKRVEMAYYATCCGIQIKIMDMGKVFSVGRDAVLAGASEEELRAKVRAFVDTIKVG
jgi:hypothetical protein